MQNNKKLLTFKDSLAFKYFSHWLPNDGLINAVDASIDFEWEYNELDGKIIKQVAVTFFPHRKMKELKYKNHPLRDEQRLAYAGYCHSGAGSLFDINGDWMRNGNIMPPRNFIDESGSCLGYSPDGDFAWIRYFGFANIDYAKQAMEQFAFIRECSWARDGSIDPGTLVKALAKAKNQTGSSQ